MPDKTTADSRADASWGLSPPRIDLPKGGGAIRGIGEKFAANPVTGTGSMSVPIVTSPGRSGFAPELSLSYDSGAGNGPFGFGWSLSLPGITRKTDKGLPRYVDHEESDVFILSGAEDLVPVLEEARGWQRHGEERLVGGIRHRIERYRPRVEGLFARIERFTNLETGETYWCSISRDNVTTIYGRSNTSRIFDPGDADVLHPTRIFKWLISESYDDKGNSIVYEYQAENSDGVDLTPAHERNRSPAGRSPNRYLKRIKYGNRVSRLAPPDTALDGWLFEVVFDYDDGHYEDVAVDPNRPVDAQQHYAIASASPGSQWSVRPDPFSDHRAGFEVRTYRRCRRVLIFHHIADLPTGEKGYDGLVRSTEFDYADLDYTEHTTIDDELAYQGSTRFASFIRSVTQSGYIRDDTQPVIDRGGAQYVTYLRKSVPPLEFEYSRASVQDNVNTLDAASLENLPAGLDGSAYQWVDLDGEGVSGVLAETEGAWFYKPNLGGGRFGPLQTGATKPSLASRGAERQQLLDVDGDGQLDVVTLTRPASGYYERTEEASWESFRAFGQLPNISWEEPNLRFVDLDGDGHPDVLITEQDVFTWHPSLAEQGFGAARRVAQPLDDERGPRLVIADGTQSIYLADMCGDGLTDLVRIRNGEVCYWANLGYGRFGAKITMDNARAFDAPDQFDQRRVRLADIDGSGTTDIIYLGRDGVQLYFNQSGNRLSDPRLLAVFPQVDNVTSVMTADLLGNGTACLVWSSPLTGHTGRQVQYVDLMGGNKPHLLTTSRNNLGAETRLSYAPSTQFYLADKAAGTPWITRLPFAVHVVERVETYDWISRNRFVTRYAYHHGYFDGVEREFRGFGMVEQWDTEVFAALSATGQLPTGENVNATSHVPPIVTRTWFHTGVYIGREHVSDYFAGLMNASDTGEYYRPPGMSDAQARAGLLDDTVLPDGLSLDEEREACRALRGSMLRQEVYAFDGTSKQPHPYIVTEQNFTIRPLQPRRSGNRHGVFFTHARESLTTHYERDPSDPLVGHSLTLGVDDYGNVLRSVGVAYPRANVAARQDVQKETHLTLQLARFVNHDDQPEWRQIGRAVETRTYEVVKPPTAVLRFSWEDLRQLVTTLVPTDQLEAPAARTIPYEDWDWRTRWDPVADPGGSLNTRVRLIEHVRTLYRPDDLGAAQNDPLALLSLGTVGERALLGETYKLALTPGLVTAVYGGRVIPALIADDARYVHTNGDQNWWIPSGRVFYSRNGSDTPAQELAYARQHFFLPHRYRDPFHTSAVSTESLITYDGAGYDLLAVDTSDALGNRLTAGERRPDGTLNPAKGGNDYRVLSAFRVMDPNRNRAEVAFDALGMVVGTAVMGKPEETLGDSLDGFAADLTQAATDQLYAAPDPHVPAARLLGDATTRVVYDLQRFLRTRFSNPTNPEAWQPVYAVTMARETHAAPAGGVVLQISVSHSDGFGREIQKKVQAEPGRVPTRDTSGRIVVGADRRAEMTTADFAPRWVGSGWTIFNNKGAAVRQYEPFFTDTHRFEFDVRIGVSPVVFYDPLERVVATLHPNHTWEKVLFGAWQQEVWDGNDTVTLDPAVDADVRGFFLNPDGSYRLPRGEYSPTWYALRTDTAYATEANLRWPDQAARDAERDAATKTVVHAATPTIAHFDVLARPYLTIVHNKFERTNPDDSVETVDERYPRRVALDAENNQREVRDAIVQNGDQRGRLVVRYDFDMLGNRIHQASMEAGERWRLTDAANKPIRGWDSRGQELRTEYDAVRRPVEQWVKGTDTLASDPRTLASEVLIASTEYGDNQPNDVDLNARTRVLRERDGTGVTVNMGRDSATNRDAAYDFKGNLVRSTRQLVKNYREIPDWSSTVLRETDVYGSSTTYDALNRPVEITAPDGSIVRRSYNEANLLERVDVALRGSTTMTPFVTDVDYDAKGQRTSIAYANGATTTYEYDDATFRLTRLRTSRAAGANGVSSQLLTDPAIVQDLRYAYDPAGNITTLSDDAAAVVQYANQSVQPRARFTYDSIYRLIASEGREHVGQTAFDGPAAGRNDREYPFAGLRAAVNAPGELRNYTERYEYDRAGNIRTLAHSFTGGSWTRSYAYAKASVLEPAKQSNRLSGTTIGAGVAETYGYDLHGNITSMQHLPLMQWDFGDRLLATAQQVVTAGTPETTWYTYDTGGQRGRKVTDSSAAAGATPTRNTERIYVGAFEIFREYDTTGNGVTFQRESLHVMDDRQRIAVVETRTIANGNAVAAPVPAQRYQLGNHLGSSCIELDENAALISYEEYHPYGTSAFQAGRSVAEMSLKRYRYTGKERDEETGFYYHGARYCAPWLGRWVSCDPAGLSDGANLYAYVRGNPIVSGDSTGTGTDAFHQMPPWLQQKILRGEVNDQVSNAIKTARLQQFKNVQPTREKTWEDRFLDITTAGGWSIGQTSAENYDALSSAPATGEWYPIAKGIAAAGMTAGDMTGTRDIVEGLRSEDTLNTETYSADKSFQKVVTGSVTFGTTMLLSGLGGEEGSGGGRAVVRLASESDLTGVAFLDRPLTGTAEYKPWVEALAKKGWVVMEAELPKGTMATTQALTDAHGMLRKIVTIDPKQATYQALLHESRHVYQAEALAKQGFKVTSRFVSPAEADAYRYEEKVSRRVSESSRGNAHDASVVQNHRSAATQRATAYEGFASGGAKHDFNRAMRHMRKK